MTKEVETAFGLSLLTINMAMRKENAPPLIDYPGIVGEDGEIEQHLIDFAVAVAAHTDDAVGQSIESFGHRTWVKSGW